MGLRISVLPTTMVVCTMASSSVLSTSSSSSSLSPFSTSHEVVSLQLDSSNSRLPRWRTAPMERSRVSSLISSRASAFCSSSQGMATSGLSRTYLKGGVIPYLRWILRWFCRMPQNTWKLGSVSEMSRDFSSRQLVIRAPLTFFSAVSMKMRTYFPNRLELSLRAVLALPKDSRMGLQPRILSSISTPGSPFLQMEAMNFMQYLFVSVLPDPLSPLITIDWLLPFPISLRKAPAAVAKMCGSTLRTDSPSTTTRAWQFSTWASVQRSLLRRKGLTTRRVGPMCVNILPLRKRSRMQWSSSASLRIYRSMRSLRSEACPERWCRLPSLQSSTLPSSSLHRALKFSGLSSSKTALRKGSSALCGISTQHLTRALGRSQVGIQIFFEFIMQQRTVQMSSGQSLSAILSFDNDEPRSSTKNDSSDFTIPLDPEHSWLVRLKDDEIARLRETVRHQEQVISDLLRAAPDLPPQRPPRKLSVVNFVQEESGARRTRRQLLLLKEFITLEREAHFIENREIISELDKMAVELSTRFSRSTEDEIERVGRERAALLAELALARQDSAKMLRWLQEALSANETLSNMLLTYDALLRHFASQSSQPSSQSGLLEALAGFADAADQLEDTLGRRRSLRCKTSESNRDSFGGEGDQRLRQKVAGYKRRIRQLQKDNSEVKAIVEGLIPLVRRE